MSIIIGGDISPTEISKVCFLDGKGETAFGTAAKLMREADTTIVNLECALTEYDVPITKMGPNLKAPKVCAKTLRDAGVDICGLANNHVFDYGTPGMRDTLAVLDAEGLRHTGIGENEQDARKPLYFEDEGKTIALVAVAEHEYSYALPHKLGVWGFDPFETIQDIVEIKKNCDRLIVMYHGGKEQSQYPSPRLRKACRAMVKAGADVVLCQHSHCIGVYEEFSGGYILYGQGNFHFVGHNVKNPHWKNGMMLGLKFGDRPQVTYYPMVTGETAVTMAEGEEKDKIMSDFAARNKIFRDDAAWHDQWVKFCKENEPNYKRCLVGACKDSESNVTEWFAHFLDCEAHTDVWRELYRTRHSTATDEN